MTVADILKQSNYSSELFSDKEINELEQRISIRESSGKRTTWIKCLIRGKEVKLNPEEIIRQLYINRLINHYKYPQQLIQVEVGINFWRRSKTGRHYCL